MTGVTQLRLVLLDVSHDVEVVWVPAGFERFANVPGRQRENDNKDQSKPEGGGLKEQFVIAIEERDRC
jgi:hypothetical protein